MKLLKLRKPLYAIEDCAWRMVDDEVYEIPGDQIRDQLLDPVRSPVRGQAWWSVGIQLEELK